MERETIINKIREKEKNADIQRVIDSLNKKIDEVFETGDEKLIEEICDLKLVLTYAMSKMEDHIDYVTQRRNPHTNMYNTYIAMMQSPLLGIPNVNIPNMEPPISEYDLSLLAKEITWRDRIKQIITKEFE